MAKVLRVRALALVLIAPLAPVSVEGCGGRTGALEPPPSGDAAPADAKLTDGGPAVESGRARDAGSPNVDASADCPDPGKVNAGAPCSVKGLQCTSSMVNSCSQPAGAVECTCEQGQWTCPSSIKCPPPPPPTCPPLAMVQAGGSCSLPPAMTCPSATPVYGCTGAVLGYLPCQCAQGQWACQKATPLSCVDASPPPTGCPDAGTLMEGAPCSESGLDCKGNPTPCGGAIFYDALQCDGSKFVTVAMTICGIDGGADASAE